MNREWRNRQNQSTEGICGNFKVGGNQVKNMSESVCKLKSVNLGNL